MITRLSTTHTLHKIRVVAIEELKNQIGKTPQQIKKIKEEYHKQVIHYSVSYAKEII
jgi:hypothetical protein